MLLPPVVDQFWEKAREDVRRNRKRLIDFFISSFFQAVQ
jgi:hypothetical protein